MGAGAGGGMGLGSYETEFCLGRENVPVTDGGVCTTVRRCLTPPSSGLRDTQVSKLGACIFYCNEKWEKKVLIR